LGKNIQEEKSTADSPPKDNFECPPPKSPSIKGNDTMVRDLPNEDGAHLERGSSERESTPPKAKQNQNHEHNAERAPSPHHSPSHDLSDVNLHEEDHSAHPGGSSVDPLSSTSRISAAAGVPESLLQGLDVSTPEESLEKLLSGNSVNTNSEGTSAHSQDNEAARFEQARLEAKFIEDFIQCNVLDVLDRDPSAYFSLKALLQKLQTDRTKESTLFLVNQVEAYMDQFARNQQLLIDTRKAYQTQMKGHASVLADATACKAEVSDLSSGATAAYLKIAACEDNIARWKAEIRVLQTKIAEEKDLQDHYAKLATEVTPAQIEAKENEGLRLCNDAATLKATAQRLDRESNQLKLKLSHLKEVYRAFQRTTLSNP
jgi:hypothetical protein